MQDFLIVYDSKTGNTEKVARALAEAAGERACLNKADNEVAWDAFDVILLVIGLIKASRMKKLSIYFKIYMPKK